MAKKGKPPKPKKRPGETKREYKARTKAWKQDQRIMDKYRKAGIDDPAFFAQQRGERPTPPPPHERPIPAPKSREEGGQRHDGSYVRRSTVDLDKIEAHLDTKMEKERGESLHERFKSAFGEDLDTPEGYELIPDREIVPRARPPTVADARGELSAEVLADVYGTGAPPPAPSQYEAYVPEPPLHDREMEPEPEPMAEVEPAPPVETEPEPVDEVEPEPVAAAEPEPAPIKEPAPPPVIVPEPGQVAGVAGAGIAGAMEADEGPEKEVRKPPRGILHLARFGKLGYWTLKEGGPVAKLILVLINIPLYILLFIPSIPATIYYLYIGYKRMKAEEDKEYEEWLASQPADEGYAYDEYGNPVPQYAPEGGYYEGEEYYDEPYGY